VEEQKDYRILVPLVDPKAAAPLLKISAALIGQACGRVTVLRIVEVPEAESFSEGLLQARHQRQLFRSINPLVQELGLEVRTSVRISRRAADGIREAVSEERPNLMLLGWDGKRKATGRMFGGTILEMAKDPPCDIALIKLQDIESCKSILLPLRGGPHANLALEMALALAAYSNSNITLMHVSREGAPWSGRMEEDRLFTELMERTRDLPKVNQLLVRADSVEEAILAEGAKHQLIIIGAAAYPTPRSPVFGTVPEAVVTRAEASVMLVKTGRPIDPAIFVPKPDSVSVVVDKWFAENTFHSREFSNLDELIDLKRRKGLSLSLVLPALNEESTIGPIIRVLKRELVESKPLLDEIVLIDGGSTDKTARIARGLGIPVHLQRQILPHYGGQQGKGDALWKALLVAKGDVIVWLDASIRNIHPRFVYGLVGPLLREDGLKLVKAFYGRPLTQGELFYDISGDRVTELTARPLINLFFPELSGMVEPLGDECAVRRDVLEEIPFFSGYGVELGILIDVLAGFGLRAIGQSDLEERIRHERPLSLLTQRALAILQAAVKRLEALNKVGLLEEANTTMKMIRYGPERFSLKVVQPAEVERPPMSSIPEYTSRARFSLR